MGDTFGFLTVRYHRNSIFYYSAAAPMAVIYIYCRHSSFQGICIDSLDYGGFSQKVAVVSRMAVDRIVHAFLSYQLSFICFIWIRNHS